MSGPVALYTDRRSRNGSSGQRMFGSDCFGRCFTWIQEGCRAIENVFHENRKMILGLLIIVAIALALFGIGSFIGGPGLGTSLAGAFLGGVATLLASKVINGLS